MSALSIAMLLSLAAPPPPPAEAEAKTTRWLVILGGGATRADADAALAKFASRASSSFNAATGHPQAVRSDSIAGLKPGFDIAVLGACDDKLSAEIARDLASLSMDGVYVREVKGVASSCPIVNGDAHATRPKEPQRHEARATPSSVHYIVGWSSLDNELGRDQANACDTRALDVAIVAKNATVASDSLYGCETLCSDHGDVPADAVCGADVVEWAFDERVVTGDHAWLALVEDERHTRTRGAEPKPKSRWHLFGYACGSLKPVLSLAATPGEGAAWSARATSKDGKRIEAFAAGAKTKRFAWDEATCAFVPSK